MALNFKIKTSNIDGIYIASMNLYVNDDFKHEYSRAFSCKDDFVYSLGEFIENGAIAMRGYINSLGHDSFIDIIEDI